MNVCAAQHPLQREFPTGTRAQCWAADQAHGYVELTDEEKAPLVREEISVADEA